MRDKIKALDIRESFKHILQMGATRHDAWVEAWGLQSGQPGPLDDLIREFEECAEVARQIKREMEEE